MPHSRGRFITFEGGEGAGKSTQLALLAQKLLDRGQRVLTTREPGGCALAEAVRGWLVRGTPDAMAPKTELLLALAARLEHVRQRVHPALQEGVWVLCDRFVDSTFAYQGHGRGMDMDVLRALHRWVWLPEEALFPDLTLFLSVPPEIGLARKGQDHRGTDDAATEGRFEQEAMAFHRRVHAGFHALAEAAPHRFRVINAALSPQSVEDHIWQVVRHGFPNA